MKKTLFLIAAAVLAGTVQAAPITINFDDGNMHGFTFFSACAGGGYQPGGGFIFGPNPSNFYATPICGHGPDDPHDATTRISRTDGKKFSLLWFDTYDSFDIETSKGVEVAIGFRSFEEIPRRDFFGSIWRNLDWIDICAACDPPEGNHDQASIDNFRFDIRTVPEPPTWALLAIGALAFAGGSAGSFIRRVRARCGRVVTL